MFPFIIPLLGAGLGAVANKKNPLKGAAIGAGLGAAGTFVAPAIGGAMGGAQAAAPAIGGQAQAGLLGQVSEYAKPIGTIANAVGAAQGLLGQSDEQIQAPPPMPQTGTGGQTLAMLAGQNQQGFDSLMMRAAMERAKRRQEFGGGLL